MSDSLGIIYVYQINECMKRRGWINLFFYPAVCFCGERAWNVCSQIWLRIVTFFSETGSKSVFITPICSICKRPKWSHAWRKSRVETPASKISEMWTHMIKASWAVSHVRAKSLVGTLETVSVAMTIADGMKLTRHQTALPLWRHTQLWPLTNWITRLGKYWISPALGNHLRLIMQIRTNVISKKR